MNFPDKLISNTLGQVKILEKYINDINCDVLAMIQKGAWQVTFHPLKLNLRSLIQIDKVEVNSEVMYYVIHEAIRRFESEKPTKACDFCNLE